MKLHIQTQANSKLGLNIVLYEIYIVVILQYAKETFRLSILIDVSSFAQVTYGMINQSHKYEINKY